MAKTSLAKSLPQRSKKEPLIEAEKRLTSIVNQLEGLSVFLKALGEAAENGSAVVDLHDLTFGFDNLLDATKAYTVQTHDMVSQAIKQA